MQLSTSLFMFLNIFATANEELQLACHCALVKLELKLHDWRHPSLETVIKALLFSSSYVRLQRNTLLSMALTEANYWLKVKRV